VGDLHHLFGSVKRKVPITGNPDLITWNAREKYTANDGLGMCNTGQDRHYVCVLGGLGCNVDHVQIARENLASWRLHQQEGANRSRRAAGPDQ
jgi:hypothetical protein